MSTITESIEKKFSAMGAKVSFAGPRKSRRLLGGGLHPSIYCQLLEDRWKEIMQKSN